MKPSPNIQVFKEDLRLEIDKILSDEKNEHVTFLNSVLSRNGDIKSLLSILADYGLAHIKDDEDDFALADYFFVLSGINNLQNEVRSFFTDVMVYCEDKHINFRNSSEIKDYYNKKILPLL